MKSEVGAKATARKHHNCPGIDLFLLVRVLSQVRKQTAQEDPNVTFLSGMTWGCSTLKAFFS